MIGSSIEVLGVRVDLIETSSISGRVAGLCWSDRAETVFYVNAHALELARQDQEFRRILNTASIAFCDGYGVRLMTRILGEPVPDRMTPPDFIDELLGIANESSIGVFLLGDEQYVVDACVARMRARHPGLVISAHHGFFDREIDSARIVQLMRSSRARLFLVGMGMPVQEKWVSTHLEQLPHGAYVSVGALFRWYSETEKRASRVWTDHGLEWLTRWIRHPIRHFGRYGVGLPKLTLRILMERLAKMRQVR